MEMESVGDVKTTVTGDAETESVGSDITDDVETDSIGSDTEAESVSGEMDTESVEDAAETKSLACDFNPEHSSINNLLANNGWHVLFGYPAISANLGSPLDLNLLSFPVSAAANEVTALQAARANLAAKEAAFFEAAAAKAALLSNSGLKTAPTVSSPLSLNLVTYPNGAIIFASLL